MGKKNNLELQLNSLRKNFDAKLVNKLKVQNDNTNQISTNRLANDNEAKLSLDKNNNFKKWFSFFR